MTRREVNKFRVIVEESAIEMSNMMRRRDALIIEAAADKLDRALGATERERAARRLDAVFAHLRNARAALQRIQEGTYGTCLDCEEPISPARLAALPGAALCIRCQEAVDSPCEASGARPALPLAA